MHEPIQETRTVYHCPWCGKPYLRKQDLNYHINMKCRKNPEHVHPCFWCEHLEKTDFELVFFWNRPWGPDEEVRTIPSFYCKKHDTWLYSALAKKHHHPCASDEEHIQMPLDCKDFIYQEVVSWNLETFIGKPWYKKQKEKDSRMTFDKQTS